MTSIALNGTEHLKNNTLPEQVKDIDPIVKALEVIIERLPLTAKLVEDSALDLGQKFHKLSDSIAEQGGIIEELVKTASSLSVGGEIITIEEFARVFGESFGSSIERILFVSKMAMYMVYSLDDAMKSLQDIEGFNTKIQAITKQTHLLSLNATIESSRAGKEGEGFRVVAHEVKLVSQEIAALSREMRTKIGAVSSSVKNSYDKLREVATTDMSQNIESRERLDKLMQAMVSQNERFRQILDKTAQTSRDISRNITGTVVGMQFQDRTTQHIQNSVLALGVIGRILAERQAFDKERYAAIVEDISKCFQLSEFNNAYLEKLGQKPKQAPTAIGQKSSDNVELF